MKAYSVGNPVAKQLRPLTMKAYSVGNPVAKQLRSLTMKAYSVQNHGFKLKTKVLIYCNNK